jgi:hypothetical protein
MLIIFFGIKGIVHKEFVLAGQTDNSAYYCDVLRRLRENVRRLLPELWRQNKWLLHHDNARLTLPYSPGIPPPPMKVKLKGSHFDTTEVIKGRIAGCAEHDFQDVV